jgi:hypothetical protein
MLFRREYASRREMKTKCDCGSYCLACHFGLPEYGSLRGGTIDDTIDEEYRQLMRLAGDDGCECGIEGCPGHEVVDGKILIENHPLGSIVIDVSKL